MARSYGNTRRDFTGETTHYVTNHHGTIAAYTNSSGPRVLRTLPYGAPRVIPGGAINLDDRNFLNQPADPHTPTVYLNNRHYLPGLGQFLSVDPLVIATRQPYSYANGNPITLSDPSGLCTIVSGNLWCNDINFGYNGLDFDAITGASVSGSRALVDMELDRIRRLNTPPGNGWDDAVGRFFARTGSSMLNTALTVGESINCIFACPFGYNPQRATAAGEALVHYLKNPTALVKDCLNDKQGCAADALGSLLLGAAGRFVAARTPSLRPAIATNTADDVLKAATPRVTFGHGAPTSKGLAYQQRRSSRRFFSG